MLAGVGILSIVVGLAVQDALRDIIRGFTIISDRYFKVGDIVKYKDITGKVILIGLRSTKLDDIVTGNIVTIANRNIEQIDIISDELFMKVSFPYDTKVRDAERIVNEICARLMIEEVIENVKNFGPVEITDYCINHGLLITCHPYDKSKAKRLTIKFILTAFEENNIRLPNKKIEIGQ